MRHPGVARLVLEGLGLSGPDALGHLASLDALRVLSLKGNALSGAVPDLSPLLGLKLLFLSRNKLSGAIPPSLGALYRLDRLDLSYNDLSGAVPPQLARLDRLLTLRLDSNRLIGALDGIALPRLQDLTGCQAARMRIAAGAARGLAFIHHASRRGGSGTPKQAHGNIKSTNILLDRSGEARLADCVLAQLSGSSSSSAGYRAPEAPPSRPWASQKGDVYAFGVVLLELLTGRCPGGGDGAAEPELPRWVQSVVREEWTSEVFDLELMKDRGIEEEMAAMLQLALSCAAAEPGQRPKVGHVVRMVDEVRAASCCGASSPSRESSMDESSAVSDSPAVSEGGGAVSQ